MRKLSLCLILLLFPLIASAALVDAYPSITIIQADAFENGGNNVIKSATVPDNYTVATYVLSVTNGPWGARAQIFVGDTLVVDSDEYGAYVEAEGTFTVAPGQVVWVTVTGDPNYMAAACCDVTLTSTEKIEPPYYYPPLSIIADAFEEWNNGNVASITVPNNYTIASYEMDVTNAPWGARVQILVNTTLVIDSDGNGDAYINESGTFSVVPGQVVRIVTSGDTNYMASAWCRVILTHE